jgi:uncharacterized protein YjbI with pentapeptide repeats
MAKKKQRVAQAGSGRLESVAHENPNIEPDLSEAILGGAELSGADLSGANLFMADLTGRSS